MDQHSLCLKKKNITATLLHAETMLNETTSQKFQTFLSHYFDSLNADYLAFLTKTYGGQALAAWMMRAWYVFEKNIVSYIDITVPSVEKDNWLLVTIVAPTCNFLEESILITLKQQAIVPIVCLQTQVPTQNSQQNVTLITLVLPKDELLLPVIDLEQQLQACVQRVTTVVADFNSMREKSLSLAQHYMSLSQVFPEKGLTEIAAFLEWIDDKRFVYLGMIVKTDHEEKHYGLLKDKQFTWQNSQEVLPEEISLPMRITKSATRSPIYRSSRLDQIDLVGFSSEGISCEQITIIGLFTQDFFTHAMDRIPLIRFKAATIMLQLAATATPLKQRRLRNIIQSIPQDLMLQLSEEDLYKICEKVQGIYNRLVFFSFSDQQNQFVQILLYIPKDIFTKETKEILGRILAQAFGATLASNKAFLGDFHFARVMIVLSLPTITQTESTLQQLERDLNFHCLPWAQQMLCLIDDEETKNDLSALHFSKPYEDSFSPLAGMHDAHYCKQAIITNAVVVKLTETTLRLFSPHQPLSLSHLMPILQNFGINVNSEMTFNATFNSDSAKEAIWIHILNIPPLSAVLEHSHVEEALKDSFDGKAENDVLNGLILSTNLTLREIQILRAYVRASRQLLPSTVHVAEAFSALLHNPSIATLFIRLFHTRFTPSSISLNSREQEARKLLSTLEQELTAPSPAEEVVLRSFAQLIMATIRTNAYQEHDYLSFKFRSGDIPGLTPPHPLFEVFVYHSCLEAFHLRGGEVARGGIRWSDRFDDYRSEVLGLMQTQMLKNTVIVPVGSKGGFICKRYPLLQKEKASTEILKQEVITCYQMMMRGLLDITDNWVDGKQVPPTNVVCYDKPDSYLVVAADKGTASFSDIANDISESYNFWLGDAFASGGSKGYNHKSMAITSRGAWVSVRNHMTQLGLPYGSHELTTVGVGDMSGDVFGNGMLLYPHLKLIAAFNHQHIFIDPTPDITTSYNERARLFKLPSSAWTDYNASLISKGGGIFSRESRDIAITPEMRFALGISETISHLSANALIQSILQAPVDLLWFGGIGTYVKSLAESHMDVKDRANDEIRIEASHIKARIVGEGANLGLTQKARIDYARAGGKINTDAIDNSAGVDCSDHEVNLKILCQLLIEKKKLTVQERDFLLASLDQEVATLVLGDNEGQNQALNKAELETQQNILLYKAWIEYLETISSCHINREQACLPTNEEILRRMRKNQGFTRPELATLMAYTKMTVYDAILKALKESKSEQPLPFLHAYFPPLIRERYADEISEHPLRFEIAATMITNKLVNQKGLTYWYEQRVREKSDVKAIIETL